MSTFSEHVVIIRKRYLAKYAVVEVDGVTVVYDVDDQGCFNLTHRQTDQMDALEGAVIGMLEDIMPVPFSYENQEHFELLHATMEDIAENLQVFGIQPEITTYPYISEPSSVNENTWVCEAYSPEEALEKYLLEKEERDD